METTTKLYLHLKNRIQILKLQIYGMNLGQKKLFIIIFNFGTEILWFETIFHTAKTQTICMTGLEKHLSRQQFQEYIN